MIYISYSFQFLSFAAGMVSLFVASQLFNQYKFKYLKSNISMMLGYILIMLFNSIGSILEFSNSEITKGFSPYNKILFFILPLILLYLVFHFDIVFSGLMNKEPGKKLKNAILGTGSIFLIFHLVFIIFSKLLPFFLPAIIMMLMQIIFFLMIFIVLRKFGKFCKDSDQKGKNWFLQIYHSEILYFTALLLVILINLFNIIGHDLFMVITSFMSMVINPLLMYLFVKYHHVAFTDDITISSDLFGKYEITEREQEIIRLVCEGKTNKEIGEILFLSPLTVRDHLSNVYRKTDVNNRMKLANLFNGK